MGKNKLYFMCFVINTLWLLYIITGSKFCFLVLFFEVDTFREHLLKQKNIKILKNTEFIGMILFLRQEVDNGDIEIVFYAIFVMMVNFLRQIYSINVLYWVKPEKLLPTPNQLENNKTTTKYVFVKETQSIYSECLFETNTDLANKKNVSILEKTKNKFMHFSTTTTKPICPQKKLKDEKNKIRIPGSIIGIGEILNIN